MYDMEFLPPDQISYDGLDALAKPLLAGQPEQFPHWLFDTQTFTNATSTDLFFYQNVNPDSTLSNIPNQAMLPSGEYFWPQYACFDPLYNSEAAAASLAGMYDEINRLVHTSHPSWTFKIKSKTYGPWPLSICHTLGGATGAALAGTGAAPLWVSQGQNGIADGGAPIKGIPIIPPMTSFVVQIHWNALVTGLVAASVLCRFTFVGPYFRAVA